MFERIGKVYKQGGLTMTIPQVYAEALGINVGDEIALSLDMDKKCFVITKFVAPKETELSPRCKEMVKFLKTVGISKEHLNILYPYMRKDSTEPKDTKNLVHSQQEVLDVLTNMGMSQEIIEEIKQYLDKEEQK